RGPELVLRGATAFAAGRAVPTAFRGARATASATREHEERDHDPRPLAHEHLRVRKRCGTVVGRDGKAKGRSPVEGRPSLRDPRGRGIRAATMRPTLSGAGG